MQKILSAYVVSLVMGSCVVGPSTMGYGFLCCALFHHGLWVLVFWVIPSWIMGSCVVGSCVVDSSNMGYGFLWCRGFLSWVLLSCILKLWVLVSPAERANQSVSKKSHPVLMWRCVLFWRVGLYLWTRPFPPPLSSTPSYRTRRS